MKSGTLLLSLSILLAALILKNGGERAVSVEEPKASSVIDASKYDSLQAALDAVPESGGIVRVPPGNYEVREPLVLTRPDTRIQGSGAASHIINKNEDGKPALILRPKDRGQNPKSRIWRAQVADLRISGNPKSGDGLLAEGINEIFIHNLAVDHHGGHGINLIDCYEDPRVVNSILTYNKRAGLNILRGHDIVVSANQFEENQDALRCIDSFNLCMNGNNLDDHLRHGVVIENTYGSVVSGNMIEECKGTAVVMNRDCYGNTVSANVIAHNFGGGVHLIDAWGCAISANTFTIVHTRGVEVGPKSGRITITGNNFSNSHIGGEDKREDEAQGVILRGATDVAITGCSFTGMAKHAIEADAKCQRLVIVGNQMHEVGVKSKEPLKALSLSNEAEAVVEGSSPPDRR